MEAAGLAHQRHDLGRGPTVECRWLHRDKRQVGGDQRRAHQPGDTRRAIDDNMVHAGSLHPCFQVQRLAGQADDAEQTGQARLGALFRPVERRTLRIVIDQADAFARACPLSGKMEGERRFADAALLVEQGDDHGRRPVPPKARGLAGVARSDLRGASALAGAAQVSKNP